MGGWEVMRHQTLDLHDDRRLLSLNLGLNIELGCFLSQFPDPAGECVVGHSAFFLPVCRFAGLLGHMARLAFLPCFDYLALIPIAEEIVRLAEIARRWHGLVTVQAQIGFSKESQLERLMREILGKVIVRSIE